jgi:hypothetical protein
MYVAPNITWHILGKLFPKKKKRKRKRNTTMLPILVQIGSTCRYEGRHFRVGKYRKVGSKLGNGQTTKDKKRAALSRPRHLP